MEIKLQKLGNSHGVKIPSVILKRMNIKKDDVLYLEQVDDKIILSVSKKRKILNLRKLFEEYKGNNEAETFEWDEPRGREVW